MKKLLSYVLLVPILFSVFSVVYPWGVSAQEEEVTLSFDHVSYIDREIITSVELTTAGEKINMVVADFVYPSDLLEVTAIDIPTSETEPFFMTSYETLGVVRISYDSRDVYLTDGSIVTISFLAREAGEAELRFTEDVKVGEVKPNVNEVDDYLENVEPGKYTIDSDFSVLPETGVVEDVATITGIIVLILIMMILIFAFSSFTVWGGVYLSLGRWESKLSIGAEKVTGKKGSGKRKRVVKKSNKSKRKSEAKKGSK